MYIVSEMDYFSIMKSNDRVSKLLSPEGLEALPIQQMLSMYDLLPDVLFWIKNVEGQIVHANRGFLEHIGLNNREQALGLTDYDFTPKHIAKQFVEDDKRVILGRSVTDRLEMNVDEYGDVAWFTTTKRPLLDHVGDIVGSYGVSRHLKKTSIALSGVEALKVPVSYVRKNYAKAISLHDLANESHLSISALERRFKKHLSKTPSQFITDVRLENARRLLVETNLAVADVAYETGFRDPSYFSRRFKRKFSQLPSEFRKTQQSLKG